MLKHVLKTIQAFLSANAYQNTKNKEKLNSGHLKCIKNDFSNKTKAIK
jgi:hypothetical protein